MEHPVVFKSFAEAKVWENPDPKVYKVVPTSFAEKNAYGKNKHFIAKNVKTGEVLKGNTPKETLHTAIAKDRADESLSSVEEPTDQDREDAQAVGEATVNRPAKKTLEGMRGGLPAKPARDRYLAEAMTMKSPMVDDYNQAVRGVNGDHVTMWNALKEGSERHARAARNVAITALNNRREQMRKHGSETAPYVSVNPSMDGPFDPENPTAHHRYVAQTGHVPEIGQVDLTYSGTPDGKPDLNSEYRFQTWQSNGLHNLHPDDLEAAHRHFGMPYQAAQQPAVEQPAEQATPKAKAPRQPKGLSPSQVEGGVAKIRDAWNSPSAEVDDAPLGLDDSPSSVENPGDEITPDDVAPPPAKPKVSESGIRKVHRDARAAQGRRTGGGQYAMMAITFKSLSEAKSWINPDPSKYVIVSASFQDKLNYGRNKQYVVKDIKTGDVVLKSPQGIDHETHEDEYEFTKPQSSTKPKEDDTEEVESPFVGEGKIKVTKSADEDEAHTKRRALAGKWNASSSMPGEYDDEEEFNLDDYLDDDDKSTASGLKSMWTLKASYDDEEEEEVPEFVDTEVDAEVDAADFRYHEEVDNKITDEMDKKIAGVTFKSFKETQEWSNPDPKRFKVVPTTFQERKEFGISKKFIVVEIPQKPSTGAFGNRKV